MKHFTDIISIAMDMENYRFTCIWHDLMVSSAAICFSGVTPAQPEESTEILTSGINALSIRLNSLMMFGSLILDSTNFTAHSWSIWSKNPCMSASRI